MSIINIDTVKIPMKNMLFRYSGNNMICEFDKYVNVKNKNLNVFKLFKKSHINSIDIIQRYINAFHLYYDEDGEYVSALCVMKYCIDSKTMKYGINAFLNDLCNEMISDTMVEKIRQLVEDQYKVTLESKSENRYDISLQYVDEHGMLFMCISTACKLIIPIINHYYVVREVEVNNARVEDGREKLTKNDFLYMCISKIIPLFKSDVDIYNKLYSTINSIVDPTKKGDKPMWERKEMLGITPTLFIADIMKNIIINLIPKYIFKKNMVKLNAVSITKIVDTALRKQKDKLVIQEITMKSKDGDLTGLDKLEINTSKLNEQILIKTEINIRQTLKRLQKRYDVKKFKKNEIDFYRDNMEPNSIQINLLLQFFAKDFGSCEDLMIIKKVDYIKLVIIFKKVLLKHGFVYIPNLLTGNITKIKGRRISKKQLEKIEESPRYKKTCEMYSCVKDTMNSDQLLKIIAILINTPIKVVDYKMRHRLGREIIINNVIVADETLRFIEMI
jgi:hypothetical protein